MGQRRNKKAYDFDEGRFYKGEIAGLDDVLLV